MPESSDAVDILLKKLRARLGHPDPDKISDSDLRTFLDDGLDEVNQDRPLEKESSITTVANQRDYALPAGIADEAYRVHKVFYDQKRLFTKFSDRAIFNGFNVRGVDIGHGADLFDNPATAEQYFKDRSAFEANFSGAGFSFNPDNGLISLYPTPTQAGCAVFFWYFARRFADLAAVTKRFQKWVLLQAQVKALQSMAMQESEIVAGTEAGTTFTTGGGRMKMILMAKLQKQYEEQFRNLPVGPSYGR